MDGPPPPPYWPPAGRPFEHVSPCPVPPPPFEAFLHARLAGLPPPPALAPAEAAAAWAAGGPPPSPRPAPGAPGPGGPPPRAWLPPPARPHDPAPDPTPGTGLGAPGGYDSGPSVEAGEGGTEAAGGAPPRCAEAFVVTREEFMGEMEGMPADHDPMGGGGGGGAGEGPGPGRAGGGWGVAPEWGRRFAATARRLERRRGEERVAALRGVLRGRREARAEPAGAAGSPPPPGPGRAPP